MIVSLRRLAAPAACALAAACASLPPAPPPDAQPAASAPMTAVADFEQRTRERAETALRLGRLAEAADAWEILTVLHPSNADDRERLEALRARIELEAAGHLQRARLAFKRGELDAATAQYAAVLALRPEHRAAADALRAIERERNRRSVLGKPAAGNAGRRSGVDTPPAPGTVGP
jgi:tetratricopeptide (TPR) repeat protein